MSAPDERVRPRGRARGRTSRPRVLSISDQVSDTLRSMILMGELRPGEQVTQERLAAELGVSTMPVREALLRLSHEGFIDGGRGRSFRVAKTTREDIADIYWMHATLAGELTARACERMSAEDLQTLAVIHDSWRAAASAGNATVLEAENFAFHRIINHAVDSPKLLLVMRNTLRMIPEHFYSLLPEWVSSSTEGHGRILQALNDRDADAARDAAASHVLAAGDMLIEFFDDHGYWTVPENAG